MNVSVNWRGLLAGSTMAVCLSAAAYAGGFAGLGEGGAGFAEVVPNRPLSFPADHGPHSDFRVEWWYVTANLKDKDGAEYGVQWTLFRQAMEPGVERVGFANQHVWMGHAAVTSAKSHRFGEQLARGGIGQAGVMAEPFEAWIDDWSLKSLDGSPQSGLSHLILNASGTGFSFALALRSKNGPVLHGDKGFSQKSARGQASYYYSQPFSEVGGSLTLDGRAIEVTGEAWMDREWSSQPLASDQKGWDWFSLHLDGGAKLMLFQLRSSSGAPFRAGTWIAPDGTATALQPDDIELRPLARSAVADRSLPTRWQLAVKSRGFAAETSALNPASWMGTSIPYWEGPVGVSGSHAGRGYLEMTGY